MATPVLVDTDMALDDWMALAFLRTAPQADLRAITVAATGEAHARPGVNNVLRLCALTGTRPVDVAHGRTTPLTGTHHFPWYVRLIMDLRFGFFWPAPRQSPSDQSAVALLRDHLVRAETPPTLVALGPLTNLAELFTQHPEVRSKVGSLVIMGGALHVPGNLNEMIKTRNTHAEWNIFIDPRAANTVLQSGVPITLVPLDATNQLPLSDAFFDRVVREARSPGAHLVRRVLTRIKPLMKPETPFCFWDPLTAFLALNPSAGTYRTCRVKVVETYGVECGRVVESSDGSAIQVCTGIDRAAFEDGFLAGLNHGAA